MSNKNIFHMLGMYIEGVRKANVTNAMVVALDEETGAFCKSKDFPYWVRTLTSRTGETDNHATSGLKFQILRDFMAVGASVVLSDVDIVWVQVCQRRRRSSLSYFHAVLVEMMLFLLRELSCAGSTSPS